MRIVVQRVSEASVSIGGSSNGAIKKGLLVLLGIEEADTSEDIDWLCNKILKMRIFNDENSVMNLSLQDIDGEVLVIRQSMLHASTHEPTGPGYIAAPKSHLGISSLDELNTKLAYCLEKPIKPRIAFWASNGLAFGKIMSIS